MRSRTNKLRNLVATYWQPAVFYGMLILFFAALSWFRLGALVGGYSASELEALQASSDWSHILESPIDAPFTIVANLLGLLHFGEQDIFPLRLAATIFGLLTLTTFYWLVRYWHGERSAILGTIIFGCSAWFLHTVRLGTPDVLLFLLLALVAGSLWLKQTDNRAVLLVGFGLAAALLYIPGMLWILVVGVVWQWRMIAKLFKEHFSFMALGGLGMLVLIAPLVWDIYKTPETIRVMAGLPAEGWPQLGDIAHNLSQIPYNLFIRGPLDPERWLAQLPVLDAFAIAMLILGGYLYWRHWRLQRSKTIAAALVIGIVLIALGGAVTLSILIPFIYLLIAAGMGFMMDRWRKVFPRNVIAQSVSVGLISIAVIASSWYGLRQYYVAWPNAPATKQVFTIK